MPHPNAPVIVRHPETNEPVVLNPAIDYDPGDILVEVYDWAFVDVEASSEIVESVVIEKATAGPGEKRARRAPKKSTTQRG